MSTKTVKAPSAQKKNATPKTDAVAKVKSILNPTADQRIKRLANFEKMADRHRKLEQKRDELNSFNVSVDGINEKMVLQSGSATFEISNTQVIAELKNVVETTLESLLEKSEKEIVEFEI